MLQIVTTQMMGMALDFSDCEMIDVHDISNDIFSSNNCNKVVWFYLA